MWACIGILAALREREISGRGKRIDISLLDGTVSTLSYIAAAEAATGTPARRLGSEHPSIVPYQAYPTEDREIMLAVGNENLWHRFLEVIERPDLGADPRFVQNRDRVQHKPELNEILREILGSRSAEHWLSRCDELGVPASQINNIGDLVDDPQLQAREMFIEVPHSSGQNIRLLDCPIRFDGVARRTPTAPPGLGEHNVEVLAELASDEVRP